MITEGGYILLAGGLGLVLLWFVTGPYKKYRTDRFRQDLFCVRDWLFKEAHARQLFDARAYQMARYAINGMIRFAHEACFVDIMVVWFLHDKWTEDSSGKAYILELNAALSELSDDDKSIVSYAFLRMHIALTRHVLLSSIVLAPAFYATFWMVKALRLYNGVTKHLFHAEKRQLKWAAIDAEVSAIGGMKAAPRVVRIAA